MLSARPDGGAGGRRGRPLVRAPHAREGLEFLGERCGTSSQEGTPPAGRDLARLASEALDELGRQVLGVYMRRCSMGKAGPTGRTVVALYLEAQDLLAEDRPEGALSAAGRGLRLARDLVSGLDAPAGASRPMTDGDARLLAAEAHDLLERLVDAGARPGVGREGELELLMPPGATPGGPGPSGTGRPAALKGVATDIVEELRRLLVWDGGEARALLAEAHGFVADRWRPGVREPEGAHLLWTAALDAVARQDMGRMRVALRRWVRAYGLEIGRSAIGGYAARPEGGRGGPPRPLGPAIRTGRA